MRIRRAARLQAFPPRRVHRRIHTTDTGRLRRNAIFIPVPACLFIAADNLSARIYADGLTNSSPRIE